ncbi:hypothetical protein KBD45_07005 [Candidatus Dojkabacteria bacterium]|nr:hypothetical protein [Candidatus Dojkabacteria bacterium]
MIEIQIPTAGENSIDQAIDMFIKTIKESAQAELNEKNKVILPITPTPTITTVDTL